MIFSLLNNYFSTELLFMPLVPNNIMNWRVFDYDEHITEFLTNASTFKDAIIDDEEHEEVI